ncbi:MAG: B12-binding domain-containing radical SAM protein [Myxococcota bacterium]
MKILFASPRFPTTYWGMQHALSILGKRATLPPLGLITVAALLPPEWDVRLVDLNVEPLTDAAIEWADAVLVGGMHIQERSIHEIVARAKALDTPTVVGGPAPTTAPEHYADADILFLGEAERRAEELIEAIRAPRRGTVIDAGDDRPELSEVPVPRFDLLSRTAYRTMSLQYSRGCPFRCEFCDIIEIFGRRPRVKSEAQVLAELRALRALGHRGPLFFVDDNFIGHKPAVKELLPAVTGWQREHGYPFDLYTEASLNLAQDEGLMTAMEAAGFSSVFLGIESPSPGALRGAGKTQNLRSDLAEAVDTIHGHGFEVMGGFIVGFDEDDPDVFEAQRRFIQSSPIPMAMVGLLMALPGTALARRLEAEGRLRQQATGDQFGRPNFDPAMDEARLLRGYAALMDALYAPDAYYERCARHMDAAPKPTVKKPITFGDVVILLRTLYFIGVKSPRRWHFWRLLARALRGARHHFAQAVAHAVQGEHLIRYTREVVLPRIEAAAAEVEGREPDRNRSPRRHDLRSVAFSFE